MVAVGDFLHTFEEIGVVDLSLLVFVEEANKAIDLFFAKADADTLEAHLEPLRLYSAIVLWVSILQQLHKFVLFPRIDLRIQFSENIIAIVNSFAFFTCKVAE